MSSSLTLHRSFLWLVLLAYYGVYYSKESFSKKKIQRNKTQPRPIPWRRAQTPCVGHKLEKSLLGPWGTASYKRGTSALSLPVECLEHWDTFNNTSKDGLEEPVPRLHKTFDGFIPSHLPVIWKNLTLSPTAALLHSWGSPAVDAACSRTTEHFARWLTAPISSLIWLMRF